MSQTPSLEEVLESAIGERLRTFVTALPGEIVSYNSSSGKASVRIRVTNAIEDSKGDKAWHTPTIQNVPVQYPGGHSGSDQYRITFPISAGDQVIYLVSTLPLHDYLNKGYSNLDIDPVTLNNLSSGWVIPGTPLSPPTDAPTDALVVHAPMVRLGSVDADELVALKKDLINLRYAIQSAVIVVGAGGANAIVVAADALATGGPLPPGAGAGVWPEGSTKVKVE